MRFRLVKAGVMSAGKNITVTRTYRPGPDDCARAIALLLSKPVSKKGGPPTAPRDDMKGSNVYVARTNCNAS